MDRLEYIRAKVDRILEEHTQEETRKFAYIHLYGVSQIAAMLSIKRNLDIELSSVAAMMHDITYYETGHHQDHAKLSAQRAQNILMDSEEFTEEEIIVITNAIAHHSDKALKHGPYDELLKDSDVLAHYLYNTNMKIPEQDKVRLFYLLEDYTNKSPA